MDAVRNVEALSSMRFPAFSAFVSMSHAYVHMVSFGRSCGGSSRFEDRSGRPDLR